MKQHELWILKNYPYIIITAMLSVVAAVALSGGAGACLILFYGAAVLSILLACSVSLITMHRLKKASEEKDVLHIYLEVRQHQKYVYFVLLLGALLGIITFVLLPLTVVSVIVWGSMVVQRELLKKSGGYRLYKNQRRTKEQISGNASFFSKTFWMLVFYTYFVVIYLFLLTFVLPKCTSDVDMELIFFVSATPVMLVLYVILWVCSVRYFKSAAECEAGWVSEQNCRIKLVLLPAVCACIYDMRILYQSNLPVAVWTCISVLTILGMSGKIGCTVIHKLAGDEKIGRGQKRLLSMLQYIPFVDVPASVYICRLIKRSF